MYHIYSFDKNVLNNKSIEDLIHNGIEDKLIISNGNINDVSDDVKTYYQAVITFNKFLIANHYIINDYNYFEMTDFKPIKSSSKCI